MVSRKNSLAIDTDGEKENERYDDGLTDAERKEQAFEMFVRDHFNHKDYSLVEHVNDKASHEHVTERSKYPDMVFRHRSSDTKLRLSVNTAQNGKSTTMLRKSSGRKNIT